MKLFIFIILLLSFISCANKKDSNDLGYVEKLPKGTYTIYNYGSRHIVRCVNSEGKYYHLNDGNFDINGIPGHDAHQYSNKTVVIIK